MAITTVYRGIEYRSRLEARWASFFAGLGWAHTYEPFDGDGYIPDFVIDGGRPMLVEIKPATIRAEYQAPVEKAVRGLSEHWRHDILILGLSPLPALRSDTWLADHPVAGVLGEYFDEGSWEFATGHWMSCRRCGAAAIFHEYQSYAGRPCGCYDGDHYMGYLSPHDINDVWAKACNDVKWYGKASA